MITTILTVIQIIVCILLIAVIMMQNKNMSLNLTSMGGGMGVVTKRGPEKVLHITTIVLGTIFIINSLLFFLMQ